MKIGFLTNEKYDNRGPNKIGSSRIRGRWVMKYCPEMELFLNGREYDAVIYQKAYWLEHMQMYQGIKIFDLCDPDWLDGRPLTEVAEYVDAFTVPTVALREYIQKFVNKPVFVIPDRIDPEEHSTPKEKHFGKARTAVWFGYSQNQDVLEQCVDILHNNNIKLVVISDRNYYLADVNVGYQYETFNEELTKHDFVLLPSYPGNWRHSFKSDNKTLTSWALKMPVAKEVNDVERFIDPEERQKEADLRYQEVVSSHHAKLSGAEYIKIIEDIAKAKGLLLPKS